MSAEIPLRARLAAAAAAVVPTLMIVAAYPDGTPEHLGGGTVAAPFAYMACTRSLNRFHATRKALTAVYTTAAVIAGIVLFAVGYLVFLPTLALLHMAKQSTAESPHLPERPRSDAAMPQRHMPLTLRAVSDVHSTAR
jgi:hypothetical protein